MCKLTKALMLAVVAAGLLMSTVTAEAGALSDQKKAQNKLLAQRAARADAIRKLAERIQGLHISSETTVRDFVTESDVIRGSMLAFLNGMRETNVSHKEDGTCEVSMEVTLETVITTLKEIHNRHYKGDKFKSQDFVQMTQTNKITVLKEVGMGAQRPEEQADDTITIPRDGNVESIDFMSARAKKYWMANVKPQGRLGAVRAARMDGMRKLVERIAGTQISSETIVRDFVTEKDEINSLAAALLVGAREQSVKYHEDEPVVEVEMAVTLETITETIKAWSERNYKGDKAKIKEFVDRVQTVSRKVITEVGMGVVNSRFLNEGTEIVETAKAVMTWPPVISEVGTAAMDTENDNKAQAKLMARRGAEMDARRKLAERLDGLVITSQTTVKDFVTESDDIRSAMLTFQQGGYVVDGSEKYMEDGTVEVTVAIDVAPLWEIILKFQKRTVNR